MMRALYTAATGMRAEQTNVDTIANNLSNVNTTGYVRQQVRFKSILRVFKSGTAYVKTSESICHVPVLPVNDYCFASKPLLPKISPVLYAFLS